MSAVVWQPGQPYNHLPALPPAIELETKTVLKQCVESRSALAELKQAAELIPNQSMLINTLPLLEARASSEIENIVTTTDKLFQHARAEEHADPATKEALRYSYSLLSGYAALRERPLNTTTAETVCSQIKGVEMTVRKTPGTLLMNDATGSVIYTPPVGEQLLRSMLANWERFLHEQTGLDPLLTLPILYLSRYIIASKSDYYRLLLKVTQEQAWEEWIVYLLKGVAETAAWTTAKIAAIRALSDHTRDYVRGRIPKIYSHELIDLIFELPYCRIQNLDEAGIAKRQTASNYLKELAGIGLLTEKQMGREKLFIHPKLMHLLTREGNTFTRYSQ
jgi:Fic family protein